MRNHHILNDLKHFVNATLNVARLVYYRSHWENIRELNTSDANCIRSYGTEASNKSHGGGIYMYINDRYCENIAIKEKFVIPIQ